MPAAGTQLGRLEEIFAAYPDQIAAVAVSASYADMAAGGDLLPGAARADAQAGGRCSSTTRSSPASGWRRPASRSIFGVVPDLAVFAKGMANGMPLSVYCGRRDIMELCGPGGGVTISSTYGGEALSLAAAKAVLAIYRDERTFCARLWRRGEAIWSALNGIFADHGAPLELKGFWPCPQFVARPGAPGGSAEPLHARGLRPGRGALRRVLRELQPHGGRSGRGPRTADPARSPRCSGRLRRGRHCPSHRGGECRRAPRSRRRRHRGAHQPKRPRRA